MRTKHILTALALPVVLAACTDEQFESNQSAPVLNRPVVGQVTFVEDGALTRLADPATGNMVFKDGDKFGMMLMDEVAGEETGNANIGSDPTRHYKLAEKAYTNYAFVKSGNTWKSEARLMEGNYFYYMPYTDNQTDTKKTMVTRNGGLKWVISANQNAFTADAPDVLAPWNAVTENQLYIGYEALDSKNPVTELTNKMIAAHATLGLKIVNSDSETIVVKRAVLEYSDATKFALTGKLNLVEGKAKAATDIYTVLNNKNEEVKKSLTAADNLADVFKLYNADVKGSREDFTKNPLMQCESETAFLKGTGEASSIALNYPGNGYILEGGQSVFAQMVIPANVTSSEKLRVRVYTNKGVVLLPLKVNNYKTGVKALTDNTEDGFTQGGLKFTEANASEATAKIGLMQRNPAPNKQGEYLKNTTTNAPFSTSLPNGWNVATVDLTTAAIQIPKVMDIYSTEDLDAFLGYCTLNANVAEDGEVLKAIIKGEGVELTKEAYAVLQGNEKIELTIEGTNAITIPATLTATDVLERVKWGTGVKAVVESNQTISKAWTTLSNLTVTNKAELTINSWNREVSPATKVTTTLAALNNLGTVTFNTPLTVSGKLLNGCDDEDYLTDLNKYDKLVEDATLNVKSNLTATEGTENVGVISVTGSVSVGGALNNVYVEKDEDNQKVGQIIVNEDAQLTTTGAVVNSGSITADGILTAAGALTNRGVIYNNCGIENKNSSDFSNYETIVVGENANFTAIKKNEGVVQITNRTTQIDVEGATGEGTVSYVVTDEDLVDGVFTLLAGDAFNTLEVGKSMTINPDIVPEATTRTSPEEGDAGYLKVGMTALMDGLTIQVTETGTYKFHEFFHAKALVVAKKKYMTVATDLKIEEKVVINSGATIQNNRGCTFTYNGITADFKNSGTFRNIGSLTAPNSLQPSGNFTGNYGSDDWGNTTSVPWPADGGLNNTKPYDVAGTVKLNSITTSAKVTGAGTVVVPAVENFSGCKLEVESARVKIQLGKNDIEEVYQTGVPTISEQITGKIETTAQGMTVEVYYKANAQATAVSKKTFVYRDAAFVEQQ